MVLAGQAVLGGVGQHAAQHPAQRVARQHVVTDVVGRHGGPVALDAAAPVARLACCPMLPPGTPRSAGVTAEIAEREPPKRKPANEKR